MKLRYLFIVVFVVLLAACGGQATAEPETSASPEAAQPSAAPTEAPTEAPSEDAPPTATEIPLLDAIPAETPVPMKLSDEIKASFPADEMTVTDSGLQYMIVEEGEGQAPEKGEVVQVHFIANLADGTEFDNSYSQGQPMAFPLGQGMIIPGWDEGIGLLKKGDKAKLIIPPELAFGSQGAGGVIPPDATLYFEVELVDILPGSPEAPTEVADTDYESADSGLRFYDFEAGSGETPEDGQLVTVHYTGWLEDGTKFDSSLDRGQAFTFALGQGQVIPGWDEGVATMQVGGKRQLLIPPDLAYGEQGAGGVIPPNAELIFEVELIEIHPGAPKAPTEVDEKDYTTTESGLKYYDFVEGEGDTPQPGDVVSVHYTGWLEDGVKFDSSLDRGQPFQFPLGMGQVIPGWDEGVASMKIGGKRQLVIPADLGYGDQGAGAAIPPNSTLIFEVELLDVQSAQ